MSKQNFAFSEVRVNIPHIGSIQFNLSSTVDEVHINIDDGNCIYKLSLSGHDAHLIIHEGSYISLKLRSAGNKLQRFFVRVRDATVQWFADIPRKCIAFTKWVRENFDPKIIVEECQRVAAKEFWENVMFG